MTLRHLRIFLMVCETQNMTAAANALFMTQPAVSQAIKELETYYQVSLFARTSKKLQMTDAGNTMRNHALQIFASFDEMEQQLKMQQGLCVLRVGANVSVGVTMIQKWILQFQQTHPNAKVEVCVNNSKTIREKLDNNELDFAMVEEFPQMEYYNVLPFYDDRNVIVAWPEHPMLQKEHLYMKDLENEDFLLRETGSGVRNLFDTTMYAKGLTIHPTWESYTSDALLEAVKAHLGIAVLPERIARSCIESGTLAELKVCDLDLSRKLIVIYHKGKRLSPEANDFIRLAFTSI